MWTRLAIVMAVAGTTFVFAPPAYADLCPGEGARRALLAGRAARRQTEDVRAGRAVPADRRRRRSSASRRSRCAGPGAPADLVKIGPSARDLVGLYGYHLDFPGSALHPGCDYERWGAGSPRGQQPTVYAHVATDPDIPGKLALQYWFFYVFNDFNNLHEGDWEMIQLDFDAADAARGARAGIRSRSATASTRGPSAPTGATTSSSSSTAPTRSFYPAAGSHANYTASALPRQLGRGGRRLRRHARARTSSSARS